LTWKVTDFHITGGWQGRLTLGKAGGMRVLFFLKSVLEDGAGWMQWGHSAPFCSPAAEALC